MAASDPKQMVRSYFDRLLNQRDLGVCDELLAPAYIDHDAGPGVEPGPASTKVWVGEFLRGFAALRVEVLDILADGAKVAVRLQWTGRRAGSGEEYHREGIAILHLDDGGRILERWSAYD